MCSSWKVSYQFIFYKIHTRIKHHIYRTSLWGCRKLNKNAAKKPRRTFNSKMYNSRKSCPLLRNLCIIWQPCSQGVGRGPSLSVGPGVWETCTATQERAGGWTTSPMVRTHILAKYSPPLCWQIFWCWALGWIYRFLVWWFNMIDNMHANHHAT